MICNFCGEREAVIFLEQMDGSGNKKKIAMCLECAQKRGISPDPESIQGKLGSLFKEISSMKIFGNPEDKLCPVCGTALSSIKRQGLAGCPECYFLFKESVRSYLDKHSISGNYSGSMPSRLASVHSVLNDRLILQEKLSQAVSDEDYEKAAIYRDYLKALEKTPVSKGNSEDSLFQDKCEGEK